ncbi:unnamed protein product [Rhizophagus irregularis]|nr:unnamed protein product [Rhizophagus irregularis]
MNNSDTLYLLFVFTEEIKSPEYLATKHPFGNIPSLNDGFQIYETRAIARYLINKYQGTKTSTVLIPSDVQKTALKRHGKEPDLKIVNEAREELNKTLANYYLWVKKNYIIFC